MSKQLYRQHYHSWQPGPLVDGGRYIKSNGPHGIPEPGKWFSPSLVVLCACGEVRRVSVPTHINSELPESIPQPVDMEYVVQALEHCRNVLREHGWPWAIVDYALEALMDPAEVPA